MSESSESSDLCAIIIPGGIHLDLTGPAYNPSNTGRQDDPDYNSWTVAQLRVECTRRGLRVKQGTNKEGRVQLLRNHDRVAPAFLEALERPTNVDPGQASTRRSPQCAFRLINLLFSDEFCADFTATGDTLSRAELDDVNGNRRMRFWDRIELAYKVEREECNALIAQDVMFLNINPSHIVPHDAMKLRSMWKDINQGFKTANASFRQSGTHDADFRNFVRGRGDVLYLWHWLQVKPQLADFVHGGMLERDQYDSINNPGPILAVEEQRASRPERQVVFFYSPGELHSPPPTRNVISRSSPASNSRNTPRSCRRRRRAEANNAIVQLARSVRMISEQQLSRNASTLTSLSDRAAAFQLLDSLRTRIRDLELQLEEPMTEDARQRLEEDLELYLRELEQLMDELATRH